MEKKERKRMLPEDAAKVMGVSTVFVRRALEEGLLPFGFGLDISGKGKSTFYINEVAFWKYMKQGYVAPQPKVEEVENV